MIPGKRFTLGDGREYVIPPLTVADAQAAKELGLIPLLGSKDLVLTLVAAFWLVHRALARNYPDIALESMGDLLDPGSLEAIFGSIFTPLGALALTVTLSTDVRSKSNGNRT